MVLVVHKYSLKTKLTPILYIYGGVGKNSHYATIKRIFHIIYKNRSKKILLIR